MTNKKVETEKVQVVVAEAKTTNTTAAQKTFAENLWNEIKDKKVEMFALPQQKVSDYVQPINLDPNKLVLSYKVSAIIPMLETVLGKGYTLQVSEKHIIVSRE